LPIFEDKGRWIGLGALLAAAACASGEHAGHASHALHEAHQHAAADAREAVRFPPMLYDHTLANMRDHLATLQRLQAALADGQYEKASHLAEERLGLTSLPLHGAHDVAPYMPQPMQEMGTEMHRAASRFAVESANASATGDVKPALAALSTLTAQCVACHAAYRLERNPVTLSTH
jgi:hypothetical protein